MRLVALSDHAGDMLADARRRRAAAEERYRRELAAYRRRAHQARDRRARARSERGLLSRLWLSLAGLWRRPAGPPPPPSLPPTHGEAALAGGVKGEQEVAVALDSALDDGWVLVKGYRNRRGEIDYLLLGPGGLFAVEVKYVNGTFRITRDRWRYVKYDNYGNPVEEGAVQDRGGRPPNVQLTEPLAVLEEFLAKRGQPVRMQPVVLLNHPKARIDRCAADTGVLVLTSTAQLVRLALGANAGISGSQLAEIERLVERDHRFHAAGRRG
ncbi:MAG: nuclease-related domain-containing protein [Trebonia sp.]